MRLQIREIILWPRLVDEPPRRVKFLPGKTNVITGASKTGKSAIIPIIDYCLGADTCSIPVNTIRDSCSWFGIIVETEVGQKLLARREPGNQRSTGDMFLIEAKAVEIPDKIEDKNTSVDAVKQLLNELAGLSQLDFSEAETASSIRSRPSFRDMAAFIFQPQNVVANPNVLFYKADTYEHQEKLRTIFPYVLGAITPGVLAKQHELSRLRLEFNRKSKELATTKEISERWVAEIKTKTSTAREFGLIQVTPSGNASIDEYVDLLRNVVRSAIVEPSISVNSVDEAVKELTALGREEGELSLSLSNLRRRLTDMTALRDATNQYGYALGIKRDRLRIADWVHDLYKDKGECVLCGGADMPHTAVLEEFSRALRGVEAQAGDFKTTPAAFDREFERIKADIANVVEKLDGVRVRRKTLEDRSSASKQESYTKSAIARFMGGLEEALVRYDRLGNDGDLVSEVEVLRERILILEKQLADMNIHDATERALRGISSYMARLIPQLDIERPDDPVSLAIRDLTIKVSGADREDYLWEIGSGANWVGYHLAVTLALQHLFLGQPKSPVPSLLVYDQPSQVYFPQRLVVRAVNEEAVEEPALDDEDVGAVKKIFNLIASETKKHKGELQSIILDHAAQDIWQEAGDIYMVEEWRHGEKLVPESWLA